MIDDVSLAKLLVDNGAVAQDDLDKAMRNAHDKNISLREAILEADLISEENLGKLLSEHYKVPYVILSKSKVDETVVRWIPETKTSPFFNWVAAKKKSSGA